MPVIMRATPFIHLRVTALGLCAALVFGCVRGGVDATTVSPALQADADGDRAVSCEEWRVWLGSRYGASDADTDGVLNEGEYNAFIASTGLFQSVPLANIDTNTDRLYTLEELTTYSTTAFAARDRNKDCVLSGGELRVAKTRSARRSRARSSPSPRRGSFVE